MSFCYQIFVLAFVLITPPVFLLVARTCYMKHVKIHGESSRVILHLLFILIFASLGKKRSQSNALIAKQMFQILTLLLFVQSRLLYMTQISVMVFQKLEKNVLYICSIHPEFYNVWVTAVLMKFSLKYLESRLLDSIHIIRY